MAARGRRGAEFTAYNLRLTYPKNTLFTYYIAIYPSELSNAQSIIQKTFAYDRASFKLAELEPGSDTIDVDYDRAEGVAEQFFNTAGIQQINVRKLVVVNQKIRLIVSIPLAFSSLNVDAPKLYTPAEILTMIDEQNPGLDLGAQIEFDDPPEWMAKLKASKDRLTKDQVIFYYLALREIRVYFRARMGILDVSEKFRTSEATEILRTSFQGREFEFAYPRSPPGFVITVGRFLRELNFQTGIEGAKTFALQVNASGPGAAAFLYTPARRGDAPLDEIVAKALRLDAGPGTPPPLELKIEPNVRADAVRMRALANARVGGQVLA